MNQRGLQTVVIKIFNSADDDIIFPFDDETTHPPPDFWLNLVLSVAIIIGNPSYIIVARLSR